MKKNPGLVSLFLLLFGLTVFGICIFSNVDAFVHLLLVNSVVQGIVFLFVACIPFLITKRMSWVDFAWPWGVAVIGVMILALAGGDPVKKYVVGAVYLFIGLRMGIWAILLAKRNGVAVRHELPRYQYRRMTLETAGKKNVEFHMLLDIILQGVANISILCLPGFLIASNPNPEITAWEVVGLCLWGISYAIESIADAQKHKFISQNEGGVCNIGLWKYSRHPNYFAEWLVWTGIVIAAVPSWWALRETEPIWMWITLGVGGVSASTAMYSTLVYLTGAIPAEYYSARKRPGYTEYQKTTNMFFPWFPKKPK